VLSTYEDQSPKFKASYINDLESRQNTELRKTLQELQESEHQHEQTVENLKLQITNMRRHIDSSNERHVAEMQHLRQDYQSRTEQFTRTADENTRRLQDALTTAEAAWEDEERDTLRLQHELKLTKLRQGEESSEQKMKLRDLEIGVQQMKTQTCEITKNETDRVRREVATLEQFQENELSHLSQKFKQSLFEQEDTLEGKEALLGGLEHELRSVQQLLTTLKEEYEAKHSALDEALTSSKRLAELQLHELEKLAITGEQAGVEGTVKQRESSVLERKLEILLRKNQRLHQEAAKLGRLVYGKGTRT
jgi:hypothetical protein